MKEQSAPAFSFGISSWSFPWAVGVVKGPRPDRPLTAQGLLEKAKALHVERVQYADNLPLEKLSDANLLALKNEADAHGIQIEVGTKGIELDHMRRLLDIAVALESPVLRTLPALFGQRVPIEEVEDSLRQILPACIEAGVVVVLENQEAYTADEYAGLMQRVNSPYLRICLDLSNALGAMEGPETVMPKLGPYCGNLHFKDVQIVRSETLMGFTVEGRPAGQGSIPIHWALGELRRYGCCPSLIIEHWPPLQDSMEKTLALEENWVQQSVAYCRTLGW